MKAGPAEGVQKLLEEDAGSTMACVPKFTVDNLRDPAASSFGGLAARRTRRTRSRRPARGWARSASDHEDDGRNLPPKDKPEQAAAHPRRPDFRQYLFMIKRAIARSGLVLIARIAPEPMMKIRM